MKIFQYFRYFPRIQMANMDGSDVQVKRKVKSLKWKHRDRLRLYFSFSNNLTETTSAKTSILCAVWFFT